MANPNAILTVNFNLKLDQETDEKLISLAASRHQPKAATVRDLIRAAHQMAVNLIPTCANGTECRCPHAHVHAPQLPPAAAGVQRPTDGP